MESPVFITATFFFPFSSARGFSARASSGGNALCQPCRGIQGTPSCFLVCTSTIALSAHTCTHAHAHTCTRSLSTSLSTSLHIHFPFPRAPKVGSARDSSEWNWLALVEMTRSATTLNQERLEQLPVQRIVRRLLVHFLPEESEWASTKRSSSRLAESTAVGKQLVTCLVQTPGSLAVCL